MLNIHLNIQWGRVCAFYLLSRGWRLYCTTGLDLLFLSLNTLLHGFKQVLKQTGIDMIELHSCYRFVGSTSVLQPCPKPALRFDDCGGHLCTVKSFIFTDYSFDVYIFLPASEDRSWGFAGALKNSRFPVREMGCLNTLLHSSRRTGAPPWTEPLAL